MFDLFDTPQTGAFDKTISLNQPVETILVTATTVDAFVLQVTLDNIVFVTLTTTVAITTSGLYAFTVPIKDCEGLRLRVTGGANTANLRAAIM
jgi:hypothetical protein